MQKLFAMAVAIGAGIVPTAWAGAADEAGGAGCSAWPSTSSPRAPCGASFRGRARSGNDRGEGAGYEIARAGEWQRQRWAGPPERIEYVNYASGASIVAGQDAAGQPMFSISQDFHDPRGTVRQTDQAIAYLGESCRVWITTETYTGSGMEHQDCITEDGVPLLHDYASGRSGTLAEKLAAGKPIWARIVRFERAAVRQDEVRPPAALFRWSNWGLAATAATDAASYEVRLEDQGDPMTHRAATKIVIRRLGQTVLSVERAGSKIQAMAYSDPGRIAEFYSYADGRPRSLSIYSTLGTQAANKARRDARWPAPVPMTETDTILGEECRWYDLSPGVEDGSEKECRTGDGIPLARRNWSWGKNTLIARATFLRRSGVRPIDLVPPDELISADLWLRAR